MHRLNVSMCLSITLLVSEAGDVLGTPVFRDTTCRYPSRGRMTYTERRLSSIAGDCPRTPSVMARARHGYIS